jgi:hypothetical protein
MHEEDLKKKSDMASLASDVWLIIMQKKKKNNGHLSVTPTHGFAYHGIH